MLVPEQLVYYRLPDPEDRPANRFVYEVSSGCAMGGSIEEATLNGLFEVIERDAFLCNWYGQQTPVELSLRDASNPDIHFLLARSEAQGYKLHAFDIGTGFGVHCIWAMILNPAEKAPVKAYWYRSNGTTDLLEDLTRVVDLTLNVASDVIVVDQSFDETRDSDLHCVKVLAPGLLPVTFGHQHRRIGPERLNAGLPLSHPRYMKNSINQYPHNFPSVMRQRNSGNYLIGFVPRKDRFDEQCLDRLIFNWIRLARMQGVGQSSVPEIGSYLYVLNLQSGKANQLRVDFEAGKPIEIAQSGDLQKRFKQASTMPMANFAELSVGVAFSCDYQKYMNAYGAFTFNVAHVMTGLLAGSFGLAAAREGRFARPVRMYDDNIFMELFEVEGTPTLQLLCGENRNNQLSFEIG